VITDPKVLTLALFTNIDPHFLTEVDVSLKALNVCARHQLTITCTPDPAAAGVVQVRGIGFGSQLSPAKFDSRLDAIAMTGGSQIIIFYGMFDALRFDMSAFGTGTLLSAALASHQDELTISGNAT